MQKIIISLLASALLLLLIQCTTQTDFDKNLSDATILHQSVSKLSDVSVHDIFSPPVASRVYAYPTIAAYECLLHTDSTYRSFAGQLNELDELPQPEAGLDYAFSVAAIHAFLTVGKTLIFSEGMITSFYQEKMDEFKSKGIPTGVLNRSVKYGDAVAQHILNWAQKDNYKKTRTSPKFTFTDEPGRWQPTPPAYMEGIEPHWREIRPFVLDSAQQFIPAPPPTFDIKKGSEFHKLVMEVFEAVNNKTEETVAIAAFWDCNPYVMNQTGHVMFATKKITPGGHWIGITEIACKKANAGLLESARAYASTSIALADAFISCWDEKYRSNLIRPETVINQHFDPDWIPVLQTPPFPEHTSGHSVVSTAAATTLTSIFGDNFEFIDSVEVKYGLPARPFKSFNNASAEAAISRLYGGIHYMPAITDGVAQGQAIGKFFIENIQTKNQ
jgi:hypothetical protein